MNYQSQALQDRFVARLLGFKPNGFFLDIGSCHAISTNNTYAFQELGWKGICVELDPEHNESYKVRSCVHLNEDATKIDYEKVLDGIGAPAMMDYLSLDIDALSTSVLEILPFHKYNFSVVTIEHDFYIHGGKYRDRQREILTAAGYMLLCADVLVPLSHDTKPDCSFEDWWIHSSLKHPLIKYLQCTGLYPIQIIDSFK